MELVPSEPPKKVEQPASRETVTIIVDKIGTIARKGEFLTEYYEESDKLDPAKFNGYSEYALERSTLPEERKDPENPLAVVGFLKIQGQTHIIVGYEIFNEKGELRIYRNDRIETEADRQRQAQRKLRMNQGGEEGETAALEFMEELNKAENQEGKMRKNKENLVGEPEAQEVLELLKKIEETPRNAPPKKTYNVIKPRNLIRLVAASETKDS